MSQRAPNNTLTGPNNFALTTWVNTHREELQPLGFGGILEKALEHFDFTITYSNIRTACTAVELVPAKPIKVKVDPVEEVTELRSKVANIASELERQKADMRVLRRALVQMHTDQDLGLQNIHPEWRQIQHQARFQDTPSTDEAAATH